MEAKNKKLRKNRVERDNVDRLSCLPDSILADILSFLDTKSAIRTSVLSKRYKLLWTQSPCLDFKYTEFDAKARKSADDAFQAYVNRVLQLREHSSLSRFKLSLHKDVDLDFVHKCLDYAAQHKVQNFNLRGFVKRKPITLPQMLLTSSSLVSLQLRNATNHSIELPRTVSLPKLKHLCLKNFEFCDRNFSGEVFSGCASLETLILSKCSIRPGDKLKVLDLNCLNLANLVIQFWRSPWKCFDEHVISVNCPKLDFFAFRGHIAKVTFKEGSQSLERACIDLWYPSGCTLNNADERKLKNSEGVLSMLRHLYNVKLLSLSLRTVEVLSVLDDLQERPPTIFANLKLLKLTAEIKCKVKSLKTLDIKTVMELLERAATDVLVFEGSKEKKFLPESSKLRAKKDAKYIAIPANVLSFILENSHSTEFLSIEIPEVSPDLV